MSSVSTSFFLPDLLALFPSQGCTNPHYTKASEESYNWLMNFSIFRDHVQKSLHRGESELLCSYAYHYAEYEILRTCCDVVNLLFVLDEVSDKQNGQDALQTGNISCNAMCDPDYEDGSELCAITKQ